MALSNEDKKDVSRSMGKSMANKVSRVTDDSKKYIIANHYPSSKPEKVGGNKKQAIASKMTKKGSRYVAAAAPSPNMSHEDRIKYYKKNKGEYIKNVVGKDGKYILPDKFYPKHKDD